MKILSIEVKGLLDKLYNLRGEDSVILKRLNKEREEALETQERTKNEKAVLLAEIDKLTNEEATLEKEGNRLLEVLGSIDKKEFATVLDRLSIDFDPEYINSKVSKLLPETIEKIGNENKKAAEKLENVEAEMSNARTKVEELGIRKDEAISNQAKLNEYIELALSGNINITRDEITVLLGKFEFTEAEQREAAKILMFPEDALYEYDNNLKGGEKASGKTITEVLVEAKQESSNDDMDNVKQSAMEKEEISNAFEKIMGGVTEEGNTQIVRNGNENSKERLESLLKEMKLDVSTKNFAKLLENYKEDLLKKNVEVLKNNKIDTKIIKENVEILYDEELKEKIEKLLDIGKEPRDICLVPSVLVKYDLKGLNNTINVLQISGLDPKKVPLMAY